MRETLADRWVKLLCQILERVYVKSMPCTCNMRGHNGKFHVQLSMRGSSLSMYSCVGKSFTLSKLDMSHGNREGWMYLWANRLDYSKRSHIQYNAYVRTGWRTPSIHIVTRQHHFMLYFTAYVLVSLGSWRFWAHSVTHTHTHTHDTHTHTHTHT